MPDSPHNLVLRYLRRVTRTPETGEVTDADLLARFLKNRDETAFELLLWRHGTLVLHVCRDVARDDHAAEDAFQATFLALVRKASSIRIGESLGAWLHQVAYRVALRARLVVVRRKAHEDHDRELAQLPARTELPDEAALHELRPILHEEVLRLPTKYRMPVVLCYLEGLTHDEAARQLGWPKGTVAGRLARARELLRKRLLRKGITLSVGLTALVREPAAAAVVPAPLVQLTLRGSLQLAAGQALKSIASTRVALLIEGVLYEMYWNKFKLLLALILALGITGGGVAMFAKPWPVEPMADAQDDTPKAEEKKPEDLRAVFAASQRSMENLKQIGLAMHNYLDVNGCFPPAATYGRDGKPLLSWRVAILPYLNQENLYKQFHHDEPWDSPHNKKLLPKMPSIYSVMGNRNQDTTYYQVFVGESTIFERRRELAGGNAAAGAPDIGGGIGLGVAGAAGPGVGVGGGPGGTPRASAGWGLASILDGTSNTLLAVEAGTAVPWTKPEDLPYAQTGRLPTLGGAFKNATHALFADGSVAGLRKSAPEAILRAAITRDGGEVYDRDELIDPVPGADLSRLKQENQILREAMEKARAEVNALHRQLLEQGSTKAEKVKDAADTELLKREHQMLRRELERLEQEAARLRKQLKGHKPE